MVRPHCYNFGIWSEPLHVVLLLPGHGMSGMLVIDERHKMFYQSAAGLALVSVLCPAGDGASCIPQFPPSGMPQHPSSTNFTRKICRKPKPSLLSLGKIVVFCDILWYIPCCSLVWLTLSLPRVINLQFPLQPLQKYDITQYGERGFS